MYVGHFVEQSASLDNLGPKTSFPDSKKFGGIEYNGFGQMAASAAKYSNSPPLVQFVVGKSVQSKGNEKKATQAANSRGSATSYTVPQPALFWMSSQTSQQIGRGVIATAVYVVKPENFTRIHHVSITKGKCNSNAQTYRRI